MSFFHENMLIGSSGQGGAAGYQIQRSLRFNSADASFLSRTPASAGNRKTWTWAGWMKLGTLGGYRHIFGVTEDRFTSNFHALFWDSGKLSFQSYNVAYRQTTQLLRDHSAWYHIVLAVDTTQATGSNRVKIYVNGSQVTNFDLSSDPAQNLEFSINSSIQHTIGRDVTQGTYFDGYLADVHFIDGQALTPTSFGEFDTNNVWQPKAYSGPTPTGNSFWLPFSDNSAATATTLGKDGFLLGNNWTPNNLSVTAGVGNDSLVDSPSNYGTDTGVGGEVRGNYCTLNPLHNYLSTASNGNLDCTSNAGWIGSTIHMNTGKWYAEFTVGSTGTVQMFGICTSTHSGTGYPWQATTQNVTYYVSGGRIYVDGVNTGNTVGSIAGDIISFAFDVDSKSVVIRKNNSIISTKTIGTTSSYMFYISDGGTSTTSSVNFGQRPFAYTAPSGFKALCTQNLPTPTITNGATAMDAVLYTGTGSTLTPTSTLGFSPDLVWIKSRSAATDHTLYDAVRGTQARLEPNTTDAEVTSDNGLTAFNSNGFTLGTLAQVNTNAATYAAWAWDAGSSTVTNNSGTISSQVRANASAGFSVVTYTGNATAGATVGHGLGVAPSLIIIKNRAVATDWPVGHQSIGWTRLLYLDLTSAQSIESANFWNNTAPTSSVFTLGTIGALNGSGNSFVAYCFAPISSYSAFGSYTGNGSADGPMVFTNMRPRWIMLKRTDTTSSWTIIDTAREGYNVDNDPLYPNLSSAEGTTDLADILSNGFKLRSTDASVNASAGTYIYACFAENPFALARAR